MGQDCFKSDNEFERDLTKVVDYWRNRCHLAEKVIDSTIIKQEVSGAQIRAYKDWDDFIYGRRE